MVLTSSRPLGPRCDLHHDAAWRRCEVLELRYDSASAAFHGCDALLLGLITPFVGAVYIGAGNYTRIILAQRLLNVSGNP